MEKERRAFCWGDIAAFFVMVAAGLAVLFLCSLVSGCKSPQIVNSETATVEQRDISETQVVTEYDAGGSVTKTTVTKTDTKENSESTTETKTETVKGKGSIWCMWLAVIGVVFVLGFIVLNVGWRIKLKK